MEIAKRGFGSGLFVRGVLLGSVAIALAGCGGADESGSSAVATTVSRWPRRASPTSDRQLALLVAHRTGREGKGSVIMAQYRVLA